MKNKLSRTEAKEKIEDFFKGIKSQSPKEIKKIKKLAMSYNISLKELRKKFCRKCFNPFSGREKIRIKKRVKSTTCQKCRYITRWKVG
ncbi:hypothetical protein A3K82_00515 [Candidatus Pacearchaeota archaeon RBG_19FT_COMBO_34_9]|nr:MAG: hypothetical protein A3K82_00515 [Candidatus Pacearchaeota archaeon RBG_19FT_COMBO_34_9]OGJ16245.1 MAG: hypothetical protein A3K74_03420 [Candidatus Pacearchaeota archaeon RBG_13_33_26]